MSEPLTTPTWGYRPNESAEIFDLGPGETLPAGWHASPDVITDPALATAEALFVAVSQAAETRRPAAVPRSLPAAKGAKLLHPSDAHEQVETLRSENASLLAEVAELRRALAASETARAEAGERIASLTTQLEKSRAASSASASNEEAAGERPDVDQAPTSAPPARTREEARETERALFGEDLADRQIAKRVGVSPSTVAAVRKAQAEKAGG